MKKLIVAVVLAAMSLTAVAQKISYNPPYIMIGDYVFERQKGSLGCFVCHYVYSDEELSLIKETGRLNIVEGKVVEDVECERLCKFINKYSDKIEKKFDAVFKKCDKKYLSVVLVLQDREEYIKAQERIKAEQEREKAEQERKEMEINERMKSLEEWL